MNDQVVRIATRVIAKASRTQPADAVLRQMLKAERGLPRSAGREVSATVFAYYRWRGWLAPARPLADQFMHAWELKERFAQRPGDFPEAELRANAVPG